MRGVVHHLDLTVRDPAASFAFYDAVLSLHRLPIVEQDDTLRLGARWAAGQAFHRAVAGQGDGAGRAHDRYSPGLHHVAWTADSREDVDRMHRHLVAIGAPWCSTRRPTILNTMKAVAITPCSSPIRTV